MATRHALQLRETDELKELEREITETQARQEAERKRAARTDELLGKLQELQLAQDPVLKCARYQEVFNEYGIELTLESLRSLGRPEALARVLDAWGGDAYPARSKQVLTLASQLAPDPERDRIRRALIDNRPMADFPITEHTDVQTIRLLAEIALSRGDLRRTDRIATSGLQHHPEDGTVNWLHGVSLFRRGRYEESVDFLTAGAAGFEDSYFARSNLGGALLRTGRLEAAGRELRRVPAAGPLVRRGVRHRLAARQLAWQVRRAPA